MSLQSEEVPSARNSPNGSSGLREDVTRGLARIEANQMLGTFEMFQDDADDIRERDRRILDTLVPRAEGAGEDMNIRNTFLGDVTMTSEQLTGLTAPPATGQSEPTQRMAMELRNSPEPVSESPVSVLAGQPTPTSSWETWKKWAKVGLAGAALLATGAGGWGVARWMQPASFQDTDTKNTIRFPADDPDVEVVPGPNRPEE